MSKLWTFSERDEGNPRNVDTFRFTTDRKLHIFAARRFLSWLSGRLDSRDDVIDVLDRLLPSGLPNGSPLVEWANAPRAVREQILPNPHLPTGRRTTLPDDELASVGSALFRDAPDGIGGIASEWIYYRDAYQETVPPDDIDPE